MNTNVAFFSNQALTCQPQLGIKQHENGTIAKFCKISAQYLPTLSLSCTHMARPHAAARKHIEKDVRSAISSK